MTNEPEQHTAFCLVVALQMASENGMNVGRVSHSVFSRTEQKNRVKLHNNIDLHVSHCTKSTGRQPESVLLYGHSLHWSHLCHFQLPIPPGFL